MLFCTVDFEEANETYIVYGMSESKVRILWNQFQLEVPDDISKTPKDFFHLIDIKAVKARKKLTPYVFPGAVFVHELTAYTNVVLKKSRQHPGYLTMLTYKVGAIHDGELVVRVDARLQQEVEEMIRQCQNKAELKQRARLFDMAAPSEAVAAYHGFYKEIAESDEDFFM